MKDFIERHRLILQELEEVKRKSRWLQDYHNYVWKHAHKLHLRAMEYADVNNK